MQGEVVELSAELRRAVELVSGKWNLLIIGVLQFGPRRHAELLRVIDGISQKMLTQTLRRLEADRLVERTVVSRRPLRVTYALSARGQTITPVVHVLCDWARAAPSG
jgi:DNA-binding HxlR family transcriptional regulator